MVFEIVYDIRPFMLAMIMMTIAFSTANYIIHPDKYNEELDVLAEYEAEGPTVPFFYFLWRGYHSSWLGNFGNAEYENSLFDGLMFIFQSLFMCVVMLNLLIAIMGDTFARVKENATVAYFEELAGLLQEIEDAMSDEQRMNLGWFPNYLLFSTKILVE